MAAPIEVDMITCDQINQSHLLGCLRKGTSPATQHTAWALCYHFAILSPKDRKAMSAPALHALAATRALRALTPSTQSRESATKRNDDEGGDEGASDEEISLTPYSYTYSPGFVYFSR